MGLLAMWKEFMLYLNMVSILLADSRIFKLNASCILDHYNKIKILIQYFPTSFILGSLSKALKNNVDVNYLKISYRKNTRPVCGSQLLSHQFLLKKTNI